MQIGHSGRKDVTRASTWVTYLLLAFGMLLPVVCVVWLTRTAVENENAVVQRLMAEARIRTFQVAEGKLRQLLESWDESAVASGFLLKLEDDDGREESEDEVAAARKLLQEARESIVDASFDQAQVWLLEKIADRDLMALRFSDERQVGPALLEMLFEKLTDENQLSEEFVAAADSYLNDFLQTNAPLSQKRYLVREYAETVKSAQMTEKAAFLTDVAAWRLERMQKREFPPEPGLGETETLVYFWDAEREAGLFIAKQAFRSLAVEELVSEGVQVVDAKKEQPGTPTYSMELRPPLNFVRLVLEPDSSEEALSSDKAVFYIWIVGIVLGLSLLTGAAIVFTIRRQASVTLLKDNLVATVTHELKTPVSSIRLLVDTLLERKSSGSVNTGEYLELISRENKRLGRLIDNFLSFSRMERNKASFSIEPISPADIVSSSVTAFEDRFSGQEFDLRVSIGKDIPDLAGDLDALATVVGNLLENAFKYGGNSKRIDLSVSAESRFAVFSVKDFGRGIAKKDQKRIFRKFYRLQDNSGEHAGSVGLGLAIVDFIVSKHSGQLELESELGKGCEFKVKIPYA